MKIYGVRRLKKGNTARFTLFGTRKNTDFTDKTKEIRVFPCESVTYIRVLSVIFSSHKVNFALL